MKIIIKSLKPDKLFNDNRFNILMENLKKKSIELDTNSLYPGHEIDHLMATICVENMYSFLITGNTGTGKTRFVNHMLNNKYDLSKFCKVNCSVLTGELFSSQFFGYTKGSFTGATQDSDGLLKQYNNGVIFLDEIGELKLEDQAKILKFLDDNVYYPIGRHEAQKSDVYLVFAINRNLEDMCKNGQFRWDLYYRISRFIIHFEDFNKLGTENKDIIIDSVIQDIFSYLRHDTQNKETVIVKNIKHINFYNKKNFEGYQSIKISEDLRQYIHKEDWPGNIRQLYSNLLKVFMFSNKQNISLTDYFLFNSETVKTGSTVNPFALKYEDIKHKNIDELIIDFLAVVAETSLKNHKTTKECLDELKITRPTFLQYLKRERKKKPAASKLP